MYPASIMLSPSVRRFGFVGGGYQIALIYVIIDVVGLDLLID